MIIAAIIVGLIVIGLIVLINFLSSRSCSDFDDGFRLGVVLIIFCVIEVGIVSDIIGEPKPTPMDVYQGKTIIEYTIRDGVKVDSVIIFKENYGKD